MDYLKQKQMTTKEYLAANAPDKIPSWFKHVPPDIKLPNKPTWNQIEIEEDRRIIKNWAHDPVCDLPSHLQWFNDDLNKFNEARLEYDIENDKARYFQWRVYFAATMIQYLNKHRDIPTHA